MIIQLIVVTFLKSVICDDLPTNASDSKRQLKIQELCPCLPLVFCPRVYGASAEDSKYLGEILKCEQTGYVRCCGVSASLVVGMERRLVPEHNLIPTMPSFRMETTTPGLVRTESTSPKLVRTTTEPFKTITEEIFGNREDDTTTFKPITLQTTKIVHRRPKFIAETMMIYPKEMSGIEKTTPQNMADKNELVMFDNDTDANLHLIFPKRDKKTVVISTTEDRMSETTTEYVKDETGFITEDDAASTTDDYDHTTIITDRHDLEGQMTVRLESIQRKLNRSEEMEISADSATALVSETSPTTIVTEQPNELMTTPKQPKILRKRRKRVRIAKRLSTNATALNYNCLSKTELGKGTQLLLQNESLTSQQDSIKLQQNENNGSNTIEPVTEMTMRRKKDVSKFTDDSSSRKRFFISKHQSNRDSELKEFSMESDSYNADAPTSTMELSGVPIVKTIEPPNANLSPMIDANYQDMLIELRSPLTGDEVSNTFVSESMNDRILALEKVSVDNLKSVFPDLKKIKDDKTNAEEVQTPKPLRGRIRFGTKIVTESPIRSTTTQISTTTLKLEPLTTAKSRKTPTNLFVRKRKLRKTTTTTTTTELPVSSTTVLPSTIRSTEIDGFPKTSSKLRNPNPLQFRKIHRFSSVEARTRSQKNALKSALLAEIEETTSPSQQSFQRFPKNLLHTPLVGEPSTMVVEFRPASQKWSIYSVGYAPSDTLPIAPAVYYPDASAVYPLPAQNNGIRFNNQQSQPTNVLQDYDIVTSDATNIGFGTYEQRQPLIIGPIPFALKGKFRDGANLNYELPYEF